MRYLIDTGILVRLPHRADKMNAEIREALRLLRGQGIRFATTRQNVAEFWNVCTRPADARGGFGLSIEITVRRLRLIERLANVLREPESAYPKWKELVESQRVMGKQVHDARIVAAMKAYRIKRILTLNVADFARYKGIEAVTPQDVIANAI